MSKSHNNKLIKSDLLQKRQARSILA